MADIFNMLDTWSGGGAFTGIKLNVTDSGSAAGSLLMDLQVGGTSQFSVSKSGIAAVISGGGYAFSTDIFLRRDAANTLAQRNGVNAQAFNLYNTYTDASNYERLEVKWLSNIATIESIAAGTGTRRALRLKSGGGSLDITNFTVTSNLNLDMASNFITGPAYIQFTEQTAPAAPATNNVRIYAEDNGSGKTRLMARFATGAAVQIAIEP